MRIRVRELNRPVVEPPPGAVPYSAAEAQAVAGLVAMLEGNPLFNNGVQHEEQERCYRAVGELRRLVGETQKLLPDDAVAMSLLAAVRAACRKYIDESEAWDKKAGRRFSMPTFGFYQLLGGLREVVGLYVWRLCDAYDLEIEGRMAAFFPGTRE